MTKAERDALRQAVADYMWSEGCACCQNVEAHQQHKEALAKLLSLRKKDDYYDFSKYRSSCGKGASAAK